MRYADARKIIRDAGFGTVPQSRRSVYETRMVAGEKPEQVLAAIESDETKRRMERVARAEAEELAKTLCLTDDKSECRPDIWEALRRPALLSIGGGCDDPPYIPRDLALRFIPDEFRDRPHIVSAMQNALRDWAECVRDAMSDY